LNSYEIFGWSQLTWRKAFRNLHFNKCEVKTVLELGAGPLSQFGLIFYPADVTISSYPKAVTEHIEAKVDKHKYPNVTFKTMSIFDVAGKYDLIVMKSVLGGVCRDAAPNCHMKLIEKLIRNNLNEGGYLLTLDNGCSFFEFLLSRSGARKNKWKFFKPSEFHYFYNQKAVGFFAAFSLASRFGRLGVWFDNCLFFLDLITQFIHKNKYPTVVATLFYRSDFLGKKSI